jgi:CDP-diacylglycerol--glycerol-3-phosphate 3-phosphatidyltransferase
MRELSLICATGIFAIVLGAAFSAFWNFGVNPWPWFLCAGALWLYCWWQTWRRRDLNRPAMGAPSYADLGWANRLTLLRGGLIALAGGFLLQTPVGLTAWIPGLLYGAAAVLDRVDGWVARRSDRTSLLGKELDTEIDALGLLVAPLLAVGFGKLYWSFLAVSGAYYIFIGGLRWRHSRRLPVYPLPSSDLRRALAGFHMGFVALVLLPVFSPVATQFLGVAFMLPMLAGFFVDWLAVSGRIDTQAAPTRSFFERLQIFSWNIFQPGLRLVVALLVLYSFSIGTGLTHAVESETAGTVQAALDVLALLILTGLGARLAAAILLVICSCILETVQWHSALVLFAGSWIVLLGAGNFSLWRGDDNWVYSRD